MSNQGSAESKGNAMAMILLFKTAFGNDADLKVLRSVATVQCQGLSVCATANNSMRKLIELGADAQARLQADPNLSQMLLIQQNRGKRATYQKDLQGVQKQVTDAWEDIARLFGQKEDRLVTLQTFVELDLATEFQGHRCEGLNNDEVFQDCVRLHSAKLSQGLGEALSDAVSACQGWQGNGQKFWRADVSPSTSVGELLGLAEKSIFELSVKDLKKSTDDFIKAPCLQTCVGHVHACLSVVLF